MDFFARFADARDLAVDREEVVRDSRRRSVAESGPIGADLDRIEPSPARKPSGEAAAEGGTCDTTGP